jgi:undecaprenyl-diphosphatase
VLATAVQSGRTLELDTAVMLAVGRSRPGWVTALMRVASVLGSGAAEIPLGLLLTWLLARRERRDDAWAYAGATLSGWVLYGLAKLAFARARPRIIPRLMHGAGWYSFPSGHSMLAPLVFGLGAWIWSRSWPLRARVALLGASAALALLLAGSRVYLGMHWPTDALGGLLLGTGWAAAWAWRWELDRPRSR